MASVKKQADLRQAGLFELIGDEKENTVDKILSKRILAPVLMVQSNNSEEERRFKLVESFRKNYLHSIKSYAERGVVLDVNVFNRCCDIIWSSLSIYELDRKVIDILKNVIKEVATDDLRLIYVYSIPQIEMIRFIKEYNNYVEDFDIHKTIDRAYMEVFSEIRENRKKYKIICI